ncbi:RDD domain-containing protein [Bacillus methanolicus PB1]|uniref:RDD domain-containing protein n=1 Tax=Bacillus methanolicus PB1 TaxID=997296 RepID=I3DV60_BACMT|nr:RDD family protein [Bacillus methanolicus]EIJ78131.1 RDD domain-containing protein [Bacillus methanolicus PB1]
MNRAGFGIRLGALFIDAVIFGIILWILEFIVRSVFGISDQMDPNAGLPVLGAGLIITNLASFILALIYYVWYPVLSNGQTFGKKFTGIRVKRTDNRDLTFWTMFLREIIGKLLSTLILFIGYLMALGKEKRGLHDYIAKTEVVYIKQ